MIITLIIYVLIIGYIILKAFYTSISIKPFNNNQKIKKFSDSINLISMPFYIKMSQIHLLCIFINLILISFIFLPDVLNNLFSNNIAYCQDVEHPGSIRTSFSRILSDNYNEGYGIFNGSVKSSIVKETYEISNTNRSFIYHLNYKYIGISDHKKVFQGLSQDFNDILKKQNFLF